MTFDHNRQYWDRRYATNNTGWELGIPSPPLCAFIDNLNDLSMHILIPGCGSAQEAGYLQAKGFRSVHIIDISSAPLEQFKKRFPDFPEAHVHCDDFFNHKGLYDLILEQTFFCALNPEKRKSYVSHMHSLLKPGGRLAGLLFTTQFDTQGPPYGGSQEEYESLFEPYFEYVVFRPCENSVPARSGRELWFECHKK
jgi:SAM-dependent methyltransferase